MAVPKRRKSKSRVRTRRSHDRLRRASLVKCKNCATFIPGHIVCPECGYYKDKIEIARVVKSGGDE